MDEAWMRQQLEQYVDLLESNAEVFDDLRGFRSAGFRPTKDSAAAVARARRMEPAITQIIETLRPEKRGSLPYRLPLFYAKRLEDALEALALLDNAREWAQRSGSGASPPSVDRFHPWVQHAAGALWNSGHRRQAVLAAASAISAETRKKVGLTVLSDTQAMKQALTPQTGGRCYLQVGVFGGGPAEATQDAVRTFAVGCFTAIRNPAAHAIGPDWEEQLALEYLAALSVLARWIDGADVVTR